MGGTLFEFFSPLLHESDDDWIFDPAIDATLEAHRKKRTRDEAFSDDDDDDDNVSGSM